MTPHLASSIEISLAERRPATAFPPIHQRNLEPESFENFDCRHPNVRLVVADEGVVPKDDVAPGRDAALRRPRDSFDSQAWIRSVPRPCQGTGMKPPVEPPLRIMRQRPAIRDPQRLPHQTSNQRRIESRVRNSGDHATEPA